jgi:hypothetical protein
MSGSYLYYGTTTSVHAMTDPFFECYSIILIVRRVWLLTERNKELIRRLHCIPQYSGQVLNLGHNAKLLVFELK